MINRYTLGINFLHSDTSASLFKNDELIAASEEERFTRIKHTSNFPENSIKYCLKIGKINISDVSNITINSNPIGSILKKIAFVLKNPFSNEIIFNSLRNTKNKISIKNQILKIDKKNKFTGNIRYVDHHLSHIASSLFFSGFSKSINISIDGFGDFASCAWGNYENGVLKIEKKIYFPHSLGIFYQSLTQFLGFRSYGDEYKVMGLSPYGTPKYVNEVSKLIYKTKNGFKLDLSYFLHHKKKIFDINKDGQFIYKDLYSDKLIDLIGAPRVPNEKIKEKHKDLAKSVQSVYEDIFFHVLKIAHEKYKNMDNLTLSGGCAMNSVANGKILQNTNFKNIYVCPNPGDAGGSVGSTAYFLNKKFNYKPNVKCYAYLGSSFNNDEISKILNKNKINKTFKVIKMQENEIFSFVAENLSSGNIVGWFQGRMEWGPRALGNRSILADARNPNIKRIINEKIKRRESFRPFAPSILEDHVKEWFEVNQKVPFMSEVYKIRKDKRDKIPGVTHVDGSGRLQTVNKLVNEKYYNLIKIFYEITKVPIILNTSFNENEPIVNKPDEALSCFERTDMDILVMENWVITRNV